MLPSVNWCERTAYRNQFSPSTVSIPGIKVNCVRYDSKFLYLLNHFIRPCVKEKEMISTCVPHLFSWHFLWLQSVFSIWEGPPCYSGGLYCYAQGNLCDMATGGLALLFPGHPCVYVTYTIGDSIIWKYLQRWSSVHYSMYYFFKDFTQYPLTPLTVTVQQVMLKYNDIKHKSCGHLTQFCESETQERSSCVCSVWPMLTGVSEAGRCLT